jgi:hypothetical protein
MRALLVALLLPVLGCASTVSRLPGEVPTSAGAAKNACESESWLVIAPTLSREVSESGRTSTPRKDGFGLYRVGASRPESIPGLEDEIGASEITQRHAAGVKRNDDKTLLAAGLGVAGLVALGIGSYLFATSFETNQTTAADGSPQESHDINGGRIAAGSILIGAGFGLGIAGIVVSPTAAERAKADQKRYVFTPPEDDPKVVADTVAKHNDGVRDRCQAK